MINIAIAGKGGVGKTTIAGTIARFLARDGYTVLAVDADPDMNLDSVLGVDASKLLPILDRKDIIAERTGAVPGEATTPGIFKLNPKVDDIAEACGIKAPDGVSLVRMGTVERGNTGCMCPANAFLRALMRHLVREREDAVVLDMEAGIEHLGRGTAEGVDTMIIVVESGLTSIETAERIKNLAEDIGVEDFKVVVNKVRSEKEANLAIERLTERGLSTIGVVPYDENFMKADLHGEAPIDYGEKSEGVQKIREIERKLIEFYSNS